MTRKFRELTQGFSPQSREKIEERKQELRQEMGLGLPVLLESEPKGGLVDLGWAEIAEMDVVSGHVRKIISKHSDKVWSIEKAKFWFADERSLSGDQEADFNIIDSIDEALPLGVTSDSQVLTFRRLRI